MAFRHVMDGRRIVARQRERLETLTRPRPNARSTCSPAGSTFSRMT